MNRLNIGEFSRSRWIIPLMNWIQIVVPGTIHCAEAIRDADPAGETIDFDPNIMNGGTISLLPGPDFGEIEFDKNLTIDASMLPDGITIDGDDPDDDLPEEEQEHSNGIRIFNITDGTNGTNPPLVTMIGMTLTGADPRSDSDFGEGGAIRSNAQAGAS